MSDKDEKNNSTSSEIDPQGNNSSTMNEDKNFTDTSVTSKKTLHHINPMGMRVLVRIIKDQNVTEGGLYLPEGAKASMAESVLGEVIEVASAIDDQTEEETNVSGIPLGAQILIPKKAGIKVPWNDDLRIVETKDVLATVEIITIS
jgi:co-chaperonin GroES (HSP10)